MPAKPRDSEQVEYGLQATMRALSAGEQPWPLFLTGPAGSGKTCAAMCLIDWVGGSIYVTFPDLCRGVSDMQFDREWSLFGKETYLRSEDHLWDKWRRAELCVLDEIGMRSKASDHQYDTLKRALDLRIEIIEPLVVISNLDLEEIATIYDDRIASRLASGTQVELRGDRRIVAAQREEVNP